MAGRLDSIPGAIGDTVANDISIPGWRGLSPPAIRRASFQVAMATGALENVDVATVGEIALAYELLGNVSDAIDHAMATLIAGDLRRVSERQVAFSLLGELANISNAQAKGTLAVLAGG